MNNIYSSRTKLMVSMCEDRQEGDFITTQGTSDTPGVHNVSASIEEVIMIPINNGTSDTLDVDNVSASIKEVIMIPINNGTSDTLDVDNVSASIEEVIMIPINNESSDAYSNVSTSVQEVITIPIPINNEDCNEFVSTSGFDETVSPTNIEEFDAVTPPTETGMTDEHNGNDRGDSSSEEWVPLEYQLHLSDSSSDEHPSVSQESLIGQTNQKKRKRGQGPMQRKLRKERVEKRRKGEAFTTAKGKHVEEKLQRPLSENCRSKCRTKLLDKDITCFYDDYRNLPSRDEQRQYLASLCIIKPKARSTINSPQNRQVSVAYNIDVSGTVINLCKPCFLCIFGESRGFLDAIVKKKKESKSNIIPSSKTGKHPPSIKKTEDEIQMVKHHILSFPMYESHYSRRDSSKKYLGKGLNLKKMFNLYLEKWNDAEKPPTKPVSESVYRQVFLGENLKFKNPQIDTCKTCDSYDIKIKSSNELIKKQELESLRNEHQTMADFHYEAKRKDKDLSVQSNGKTVTAVFDLQKCLETPYLNTSISFYKRKLWTYNLTVKNCATKETSCYMWHEGVAQRGANEIASCLFKFIINLPDTTEHLIFYSDTCPGQNRNSILPVMFMYVISKKINLKTIEHKFLVPGHTHLECDSDHALIERFKKKHETVLSIPQDWMTLVRMTNKNFTVHSMSQNDFYSFSTLLSTHFVKRTIDIDRKQFNWTFIFHIKISDSLGEFDFKYRLEEDVPFRRCSLRRRGRQSAQINSITSPPLLHTSPLPIERKKFNDIIDLLQFLDPVYHDFYNNLQNENNIQNDASDSEDNYDDAE